MKLYQSKAWLTVEYQKKGRSMAEIAMQCGVDPATIYRWLVKFNLNPNRRGWG